MVHFVSYSIRYGFANTIFVIAKLKILNDAVLNLVLYIVDRLLGAGTFSGGIFLVLLGLGVFILYNLGRKNNGIKWGFPWLGHNMGGTKRTADLCAGSIKLMLADLVIR